MQAENVSIVIPTITGREAWLKKCLKAYAQRARGAQIIVVKDEPSCGHAWAKGALQATGDYIHFTADDLTPRAGWLAAAIKVVNTGALPAASVIDTGGKPLACEAPVGEAGEQPPNILVPFFSREQFERGDWILPCHYGTDDWITYLAVERGIEVRFTSHYSFRHWVAPEGRDYTRRGADVEVLVKAMARHGRVPKGYSNLLHELYGCPKACHVIVGSGPDRYEDTRSARAVRIMGGGKVA